jgi:hypothetical protein
MVETDGHDLPSTLICRFALLILIARLDVQSSAYKRRWCNALSAVPLLCSFSVFAVIGRFLSAAEERQGKEAKCRISRQRWETRGSIPCTVNPFPNG